ncbi:MAG: selenocysteine-specific translation elongation factor [Clostridiales bacterium]|nr:selenocysteine-specific translation elongation factor [Clostridiales bacterium]
MKNIIIGTAGHIDHGKTTLIKALTGRNTDRLKEEIKRGISIDLGFTYFDLPSGKRAGIIDVPGHEKFIKNMLAGIGGIDIVMLVIAADEGIMPQTKEHLDILSILEIKKGIIVLTKSNMVDKEWIELVKEEIKIEVKDTFLENTNIISVDSIEGEGISDLIKEIDVITTETESRDTEAFARMSIDRVFTITGFGTVVTGTLIEGIIAIENTMEILPQKTKVRVRNIQVHGNSVEKAFAGQRVAINLANIKKETIDRGHVLAATDSMIDTMMIDVKLSVLKDSSRIIKNRERVRLYIGASEILARVAILNAEEILPEESAYAQLRLEEPTAVKKGDIMVIRFYSPMETIGGAKVIENTPKKHKRFDKRIIEELALKEKGNTVEIIENFIEKRSKQYLNLFEIVKTSGYQENEVRKCIIKLAKFRKIIILDNIFIVHINYYDTMKKDMLKILDDFHSEYPLRCGILKEEIKSKISNNRKSKAIESLLKELQREAVIRIDGKYVSRFKFSIKLDKEHNKIKQIIEKIYSDAKFTTPPIAEALATINYNKEKIDQVLESMIGNELIKISGDIYLHFSNFNEAKDRLENFLNINERVTLAEYRDLLKTSRKYTVALLEYFDKSKITRRDGDKRVLFNG